MTGVRMGLRAQPTFDTFLNGAPTLVPFIRHTLVIKYVQLGVKILKTLFYRPKEIHHIVKWSFLKFWFFSSSSSPDWGGIIFLVIVLNIP